jgi:hypothetical protein
MVIPAGNGSSCSGEAPRRNVEATLRRIAEEHGIAYDGGMTLPEFCLAVQSRARRRSERIQAAAKVCGKV